MFVLISCISMWNPAVPPCNACAAKDPPMRAETRDTQGNNPGPALLFLSVAPFAHFSFQSSSPFGFTFFALRILSSLYSRVIPSLVPFPPSRIFSSAVLVGRDKIITPRFYDSCFKVALLEDIMTNNLHVIVCPHL